MIILTIIIINSNYYEKTRIKGDHKHGMKLSKPVLKQMIIKLYSPFLLPRYIFLNPPKKNLNKLKTQHYNKFEKKK